MHHTAKPQPDSHLDTPAQELRWREVSTCSTAILPPPQDNYATPVGRVHASDLNVARGSRLHELGSLGAVRTITESSRSAPASKAIVVLRDPPLAMCLESMVSMTTSQTGGKTRPLGASR